MLTTQACGANPGFYRSFPCVNKTPNNKHRLKTYQNKKALLPEGVSNSLCLCISSCCLHTAKVTASLQAQVWPLYARGFDELQWDLMGGSPNGVCPDFPSPPPQQSWAQSLFLCTDLFPSHRGAYSGQALLGVEGIPVPHKIHFLHRYFCSKIKLGMCGAQLVTKAPFKTWAGRNNI